MRIPLSLKTCVRNLALNPIQRLSGGSDRIFIRTEKNGETFVLMYDNSPFFDRYIKIQKLLKYNYINAPDIFSIDRANHCILMEDIGNMSLFKYARKLNLKEKENTYVKVIDFLINMQRKLEHSSGNIFGIKEMNYELSYFEQSFLLDYKGIVNPECMDKLRKIPLIISRNCPYTFMHRDFQSQNIYIKKGQIRIIDFQTAKKGPVFYDAASLIRDPYVNLPKAMRQHLEEYYFENTHNKNKRLYLLCALQRNLQVLAAFAFLSKQKGKKRFERFIKPGILLLKELVEQIDEARCLLDVNIWKGE